MAYELTKADLEALRESHTCKDCERIAGSPFDLTDDGFCAKCMETRYNDLKRLCDALRASNNDLRNALGTAQWIQGKLEEKGAWGQGFEEWDEINKVAEEHKL